MACQNDFDSFLQRVDMEHASLEIVDYKSHVALPSAYFGKVKEAVATVLTNVLLYYSQTLNGLPLAFNNKKVKLLSRVGEIVSDQSCIHFDVETELVVFKPKLDDIVQESDYQTVIRTPQMVHEAVPVGTRALYNHWSRTYTVVLKQGFAINYNVDPYNGTIHRLKQPGQFSCLIHDYIYAFVTYAQESLTPEVGDDVLFKVTKLEHDGFGLLSINGELERLIAEKNKTGVCELDSGIDDEPLNKSFTATEQIPSTSSDDELDDEGSLLMQQDGVEDGARCQDETKQKSVIRNPNDFVETCEVETFGETASKKKHKKSKKQKKTKIEKSLNHSDNALDFVEQNVFNESLNNSVKKKHKKSKKHKKRDNESQNDIEIDSKSIENPGIIVKESMLERNDKDETATVSPKKETKKSKKHKKKDNASQNDIEIDSKSIENPGIIVKESMLERNDKDETTEVSSKKEKKSKKHKKSNNSVLDITETLVDISAEAADTLNQDESNIISINSPKKRKNKNPKKEDKSASFTTENTIENTEVLELEAGGNSYSSLKKLKMLKEIKEENDGSFTMPVIETPSLDDGNMSNSEKLNVDDGDPSISKKKKKAKKDKKAHRNKPEEIPNSIEIERFLYVNQGEVVKMEQDGNTVLFNGGTAIDLEEKNSNDSLRKAEKRSKKEKKKQNREIKETIDLTTIQTPDQISPMNDSMRESSGGFIPACADDPIDGSSLRAWLSTGNEPEEIDKDVEDLLSFNQRQKKSSIAISKGHTPAPPNPPLVIVHSSENNDFTAQLDQLASHVTVRNKKKRKKLDEKVSKMDGDDVIIISPRIESKVDFCKNRDDLDSQLPSAEPVKKKRKKEVSENEPITKALDAISTSGNISGAPPVDGSLNATSNVREDTGKSVNESKISSVTKPDLSLIRGESAASDLSKPTSKRESKLLKLAMKEEKRKRKEERLAQKAERRKRNEEKKKRKEERQEKRKLKEGRRLLLAEKKEQKQLRKLKREEKRKLKQEKHKGEKHGKRNEKEEEKLQKQLRKEEKRLKKQKKRVKHEEKERKKFEKEVEQIMKSSKLEKPNMNDPSNLSEQDFKFSVENFKASANEHKKKIRKKRKLNNSETDGLLPTSQSPKK